MPTRRLIVLRNGAWSNGAETQKAAREAPGGRRHLTLPAATPTSPPSPHYAQMSQEAHPLWGTWLAERKPASGTALLAAALAGAVEATGRRHHPSLSRHNHRRATRLRSRRRPGGTRSPSADSIVDRHPAVIELESLRRHTAIFAGSGSGKTVLIRRMVEECALQGVSSIVLDPNNDLARLGDPWPEAPPGWGGEDAVRSRAVPHEHRRRGVDTAAGGRPTADVPAAARLRQCQGRPRRVRCRNRRGRGLARAQSKVDGATAKATLGQAVLKEALRFVRPKWRV